MTINPRLRERRLIEAIEKLASYYGLKTSAEDVSAVVDIISQQTIGSTGISRSTPVSHDATEDTELGNLINSILNSPIGSYVSEDIAENLNRTFNSTGDSSLAGSLEEDPDPLVDIGVRQNFQIGNIIQIIGDGEQVRRLRSTFPQIFNKLKYVGIVGAEGAGGPGATGGSSIPMILFPQPELANMSKMSIMMLNSPQLNLSSRYTKAASLFLNGVPKIEISKAVPYLEVNFELPIPAVDSDNKLLAPSIYKFILGGVNAPTNSTLYSLQTANSSSNQTGETRNYSVLGMEAFLSPQILFNQRSNRLDSSDARVNNVLDPTRPILSLKSFSTSEVPSYAAFGYRTASLQFTLHDRSRMPDIAPFIRADLRGNTRVEIEYGWHHPDGEELIRGRRQNISPYVDLINGMRKREKFQIRNSSFSFRENGSVDISLELVTLGQSQMASELIIGSSENLIEQIRNLQELQENLSRLLERTNLGESSGNGDRPSAEIRGIEALQPASDAFASGLRLTSEQRQQFQRLLASLRGGGNIRRAPILTSVANALEEIWGNPSGRSSTTGGAAAEVRTSLQTEITNIVNSMKEFTRGRPSGTDTTGWPIQLSEQERQVGDPLILRTRPARGLPGLSGIADLSRGNGRRGPASSPTESSAAPGGAPGAAAQETQENPTTPSPRGTGLSMLNVALTAGALASGRTEAIAGALAITTPSARTTAPAATAAAATETPAAAEPTPTATTATTRRRTGSVGPGFRFRGTVPSYLEGNDGLQNYSVSLATLMANFVGKPLMMTGTFEEIQFIYYPFNENAGYARYINIGNFEVNLGMLTDLLIEYRLNNMSRSGNMTLHEFWNFIVSNIIDNPASSSYGLWDTEGGTFYRRPTEREESNSTIRRWTARAVDDETTLNSRIADLLLGVTPTGEFHPPQLRLVTECVPVKRRDEDGEDIPVDNRKNILKIHIYDQQTTSVAGIGELLQAERNRALSLDGRPESNSDNSTPLSQQWNSYRLRLIQQAVDAGIIQNVGGSEASDQRFVVVGGSNAIKNFVMNNVPYLIPGTQTSLINNVNLSSLQDEAANTLNLVNAPRPAELISPNGEEPGGLPLQVIPVEMTMNTFGCPLLGFASQFFVDLKTGTTADDLYAVNQISSEMQPGKYTTQIKLRPISGYTRYRNYLNEIRQAVDRIHEFENDEAEAARSAEANSRGRPPRRPAGATGSGSGTST